jgi:hypothetical protein
MFTLIVYIKSLLHDRRGERIMEERQLKKGKIERVDSNKITIFNDDGGCQDAVSIGREDADAIRDLIGTGSGVFYILQGNQLLGIGAQEFATDDLWSVYEAMPKETGCVTAA